MNKDGLKIIRFLPLSYMNIEQKFAFFQFWRDFFIYNSVLVVPRII